MPRYGSIEHKQQSYYIIISHWCGRSPPHMYRNVVLITLEPEEEFLWCNHLNSTSLAVFSLNTNNFILSSSLLLIFRQSSFKVMYRIITIKKDLLKYKLTSDDKCPFCLNPDSIEHTFYIVKYQMISFPKL